MAIPDNELNSSSFRFLLECPNEQFLEKAYLILVGRKPDEIGLLHYAQRLHSGIPRQVILAELWGKRVNHGRSVTKSAEMDKLFTRYQAIRALPLGKMRWHLLPRLGVRVPDASRFDWIGWARSYLNVACLSEAVPAMQGDFYAPFQSAASIDRPYLSSDELLTSLEELKRTVLFDKAWYLFKYSDVALDGIDPAIHYMQSGCLEGRIPSALFDTIYYLSQFHNDDKPANPLQHYLRNCWKENQSPCEYFDQRWYLHRTGIISADAVTPLDHYLAQKSSFPHDPSPSFSNNQYLVNNPDVAVNGINPLRHYLQSGRKEDRKIHGRARYRVALTKHIPMDCNALIFVTFCPTGRFTDLQLEMIEIYRNAGFFVITVINSGDFNRSLPIDQPNRSDIIIVRENVDFDFGGWAEAIRVVGGLADMCRSVTFTNDSIIPLPNHGEKIFQFVLSESSGIVFMTRNKEVREHEQSYFFTIHKDCLKNNALQILLRFSNYNFKDYAIYKGELMLGESLRNEGFNTYVLFNSSGENNPTINKWRELIRAGFPFVKVQLFSAGLERLSSSVVLELLGDRITNLCALHLEDRTGFLSPRLPNNPNALPVAAIENVQLIGPIGQLQAYNYPLGQNPILIVPFEYDDTIETAVLDVELDQLGKVLAIIHCFYVDVAEIILEKIDALGLRGLVLCTTDTAEKKSKLDEILSKKKLNYQIIVTPNRGRDVAPFLVEGFRYLDGYDYVLHLHTKKSPHSGAYSDWGQFLFENLIGSPKAVLSILRLLASGKAGLVYSNHFHEVEGLRNWGFDYENARAILLRMGIQISIDQILEFPTSTMFWARVDAIQPLFDLQLTYDEFSPESGQIDGTLAHAIERCLLYVCEHAGYQHYMIAIRTGSDSYQYLRINCPDDLEFLEVAKPSLLESFGHFSNCYVNDAEIYPVQIVSSTKTRPRLNVLIPTMQPEQIYGGISSALTTAMRVFDAFSAEIDLRIIVTSAYVELDSLEETARRVGSEVLMVWPHADINCTTIVPLLDLRHTPISLRSNDIFFATAWWTADLAYRLHDSQKRIYGLARKVIYLIQDYEPGFYPWSFQSVMAKNTYSRGADTFAIFNSEELANFMIASFDFPECRYIPYEFNASVAKARIFMPKENVILVYGRPSVSRNLFRTILEGLRIWQNADPINHQATKIVFAGEDFDDMLITELMNAKNAGKLALDDYADILSCAAIGISLMESPHPSYPPLEMSSCGAIVITNSYANKNLKLRSKNIISLDVVSPKSLSLAIDEAFSRIKIGEMGIFTKIKPVDTDVEILQFDSLLASLLDSEC